MKLITLNTHSLREPDYRNKLRAFVASILREKPDIIALQEVNQTTTMPLWNTKQLFGQYPLNTGIPLRRDNHAAMVAQALNQAGMECHWVWLPVKVGYGCFDEGVALLSLGRPITNVRVVPLSPGRDYSDWRSRSALGIQVAGLPDWFYTVHMGWWEDAEDSFACQWEKLHEAVAVSQEAPPTWLLGDFNAPDVLRGESYDTVAANGWFDTHRMAQYRDNGITVSGVIDGWREKLQGASVEGLRLDYIWCSRQRKIFSSRVVFNGMKEPVVSDHFGVMIETRA